MPRCCDFSWAQAGRSCCPGNLSLHSSPPVGFTPIKDSNGGCARLVASQPCAPCVLSRAPRVRVLCVCLTPLTSDSAFVSRPVLPPDQSTGRHLILCPVSRILSKERSLDGQCQTCPEMPHTGVSYLPPPRSKRALRCQRCPKPPPRLPSPAQETPALFTRPDPPSHSTPPGPAPCVPSAIRALQLRCPALAQPVRRPRAPAWRVWRAGLAAAPTVSPRPYVAPGLGRALWFMHPSRGGRSPAHHVFSCIPTLPGAGDVETKEKRRGTRTGRSPALLLRTPRGLLAWKVWKLQWQQSVLLKS